MGKKGNESIKTERFVASNHQLVSVVQYFRSTLQETRNQLLESMKVQRASHCVYQIRYHIVFCIKYRHSLLLVEERCEYLNPINPS